MFPHPENEKDSVTTRLREKTHSHTLGVDVQKLKHDFLSKSPYITLIIDEGNNWSKACPLYVAVLACSQSFEWRIMFIGQVLYFFCHTHNMMSCHIQTCIKCMHVCRQIAAAKRMGSRFTNWSKRCLLRRAWQIYTRRFGRQALMAHP